MFKVIIQCNWNVLDDLKEFITQCYRDILIREPDPSGLESYIKKIKNREISREQLPSILRKSEEFKQIEKNGGKIRKDREKIFKHKEKILKKEEESKGKIRKVRYGKISVSYSDDLDGGGRDFGQDFIPVVKDVFGKVPRICEFASGPGFIGFSLLAHGLCDNLCLIDVNTEAVRICKKTIQENKLEDRVSVYLSNGLADIPSSEKWDLVVSNPPHYIEGSNMPTNWFLRVVDPDWKIHQEFYANIEKFLKTNGSILFLENVDGSMPWVHSEMIIKNGLELVDCFWHKKFNTLNDALSLYKHYKVFGVIPYYKKILKEILKPSPYIFYFIWSRKNVDGQKAKNL